jgi:chromatin assembly factor 1 subunit B
MLNPLTASKAAPVVLMGDGTNDPAANPGYTKGKNLFADSTVPSFFRRPAFSPDGALFVAPTGIYRPEKTVGKELPSSSFCTHVFSREYLTSPIISLTGLEEPSIAVKFSPILYRLVSAPGEKGAPTALIPGDYRFVFAVVTVSSVLIYDTQHPHPIARIGGLHWACINDAAWSSDGLLLTVCSSDGYLTFIRFSEGAFGEWIGAGISLEKHG